MQNTSAIEFNKEVTLIGTYTKSFLSKKENKDHSGHYKIIINDSLEVNLLPPYHKEAERPEDEVQKFEGKKVAVTGVVSKNTSLSEPSLENQPLKVDIPCFVTIESIRLANE